MLDADIGLLECSHYCIGKGLFDASRPAIAARLVLALTLSGKGSP